MIKRKPSVSIVWRFSLNGFVYVKWAATLGLATDLSLCKCNLLAQGRYRVTIKLVSIKGEGPQWPETDVIK